MFDVGHCHAKNLMGNLSIINYSRSRYRLGKKCRKIVILLHFGAKLGAGRRNPRERSRAIPRK